MVGPGTTTVHFNANLSLPLEDPSPLVLESRTLRVEGNAGLQTVLRLVNNAAVSARARLIIGVSGELIQSGPGFEVSPAAAPDDVQNFGRIAIGADPTPLVLGAGFENRGRIYADRRTVDFKGGFIQTAGEFYFNDARFPARTVGVERRGLEIQGGVLYGIGEVESARFSDSGALSHTFEPGGRVASLIKFARLQILAAAKMVVKLGGREEFEFGDPGLRLRDRYIVSGRLELGGDLQVRFDYNFNNVVLASDSFPIVTLEPGSVVVGEFANVPFGGRIRTVDGFGSFRVEKTSSSITLSEFKAVPLLLLSLLFLACIPFRAISYASPKMRRWKGGPKRSGLEQN
jgi:hypothetical protein